MNTRVGFWEKKETSNKVDETLAYIIKKKRK